MNKDLYTQKTDIAWDKVYNRLEQDGLMHKKSRRIEPFIWTKKRLSITAIARGLGVLAVLSTLYFAISNEKEPMLTAYNSDQTTSLVKTLEDGSIVYLGGNSKLDFPSHFISNKREVELQGTAYFDVAHRQDQPFIIRTETTLVEVLGTAFNIRNNDGVPFELSVNRGRVKVKDIKTDSEAIVDSGRTITIDLRGLHLRPTKDETQFERMQHCMRFKDETLGNILTVVNRLPYKQKIQTTSELQCRRLTVSFSNDSPLMMATLISAALNLKYTQQRNIITIR